MTDQELFGHLVFLTPHADSFIRETNPGFTTTNIILVNRIARVAKVFDWNTAEGKYLLKEREKTGKWEKLNRKSKDYKFVVTIYYPELEKNDKQGIMVDQVMPRYHPSTKQPLFEPVPKWMVAEVKKRIDTSRTFNITPKKGR